MTNSHSKDTQVMGIHNARRYVGDKLFRVARRTFSVWFWYSAKARAGGSP